MGIGSAFSKASRNLFANLVRILKPPRKSVPDEWHRRLDRMKKCGTQQELLHKFGEPAHKAPSGEFEIWHYPLGLAGGFLYSIHAATTGHDLNQIYMHMEPVAEHAQHQKI